MRPYNGDMLSIILIILLIILSVFVSLILKHINTMANISTLAPRLQELQSTVNALAVNVQLLKDRVANAGEIPPEVEAALSNLSSSIQAIAVNAAPAPAPSPLP
jgi:hypothetical protein